MLHPHSSPSVDLQQRCKASLMGESAWINGYTHALISLDPFLMPYTDLTQNGTDI